MRHRFLPPFGSHILWLAAVLVASALHGHCAEPRDSISLSTVIVEARGAKSLTSSAPVYGIEARHFDNMGITGVADLLQRLPGVTLKDYGGAGGLKTVSVRGFGAAHTGVIYDGVALSDARSGEIDLSRYSLDDIGAVSLSVGDNDDIFTPARAAAMAATLTLSTDRPQAETDSLMLTTRIRGGSFGLINPFIKIGATRGSGAAYWLTGDYTHADNNYPFTIHNGSLTTHERRRNSRMDSWHTEANVSVPLTASTTLTGKAYYYDNSRQLPGTVVIYNNVSNERLHERNAFAQASVRSAVSPTVSVLGNAKWNWSHSAYSDRDGKYPGGVLDQRYWQREWYGSASALWMPAQGWSMVYAADYVWNGLNSNLSTDVGPGRHTVLQTLTARYRTGGLTATVRGLLSLYYNYTSTGDKAKDPRRLSPSVSVAYDFGAVTLRASYKNIFRVPTFNELYFYRIGSLDLRPETTDQLNLGVTGRFTLGSASLTATADGYVNHVRDKIVAIPFNMFVWRMLNLHSVRSVGVDVTAGAAVRLAPGHLLTAEGSGSMLRCTTRGDRTASDYGKQVAYTPVWTGSLSAGWENPWVCLSLHATSASERWATNNHSQGTRIDGYTEVGAALWRRFSLGHHLLEARIDAINLLDARYEVIARYPMPGRQWQASLKFQF